jgi:hypothetical protein
VTDAQSARLKKRFLEHFARLGNVTAACDAAGIKRRRVIYEWKEHDDEFVMAYREAEQIATEVLEAEARRRAVEGVTTETPLIYRGKVVDTVVETKYSDTLLIFLLKARDPEKYRENVNLHHSGRVRRDEAERPDLSALSLEELELYERLYAKATSADA